MFLPIIGDYATPVFNRLGLKLAMIGHTFEKSVACGPKESGLIRIVYWQGFAGDAACSPQFSSFAQQAHGWQFELYLRVLIDVVILLFGHYYCAINRDSKQRQPKPLCPYEAILFFILAGAGILYFRLKKERPYQDAVIRYCTFYFREVIRYQQCRST